MMKKVLLLAGALMLASVAAYATTAAPPLFILGEACPAGSAVSHPWSVIEDRDGNGFYDTKTIMNCDGVLRWGSLSVQTEQGHTPPGAVNLTSDFSYEVCSNQLYSWEVVLLDGANQEVCRVEVNCSQVQSTSCEDPSIAPPVKSGFDPFGFGEDTMMERDGTVPGTASTVTRPATPSEEAATEPRIR